MLSMKVHREQHEEERANMEERGTVQRGLDPRVPRGGSGRSENGVRLLSHSLSKKKRVEGKLFI